MRRRAESERAPDAKQSRAVRLIKAPQVRVVVVTGLRLMGFALFQQHPTIRRKYGADGMKPLLSVTLRAPCKDHFMQRMD